MSGHQRILEAQVRGRATRKKNLEELATRLRSEYEKNPSICKFCGEVLPFEKRKASFCNSSHAASFNNKVPKRTAIIKQTSKEKLIAEWLETGLGVSSTIAKTYIIKTRGMKCQKCGWAEINPTSNRIPLELHHVDGDHLNNAYDNLELLCPNCHSLTPNFKGYNKKSTRTFRNNKYI